MQNIPARPRCFRRRREVDAGRLRRMHGLARWHPVSFCLMAAPRRRPRNYHIERLAPDHGLHPMQRAFLDAQAFQCGFCAAGMIMTAASYRPVPAPDLLHALKGNLCRCTGYRSIVDALSGVTTIEEDTAGKACGASLPKSI